MLAAANVHVEHERMLAALISARNALVCVITGDKPKQCIEYEINDIERVIKAAGGEA